MKTEEIILWKKQFQERREENDYNITSDSQLYVNMPVLELIILKSEPKLCLHFFSSFLAALCILTEFT